MNFLLFAGFAGSIIEFRGGLIDELLKKGITVHVAAPDLVASTLVYEKLLKKGVVPHNLYLSRTGVNPITDLHTLFSIYLLIRRIKPDMVLGYTVKPVTYGAIAARALGVKFYALITGLGLSFVDDHRFSKRLLRLMLVYLYKVSLSGVSRIIFQNADDKQLFFDLGIIGSEKESYVVNGSGVDLSKYSIASFDRGMHFLMISRMIASKGVREYVSASKMLRELYPDVKCSLAGPVDNSPDAININELNQWVESGIVDYLGQLDDVRPSIAQCSVFVLPSYYREGVPRSILEAMSMGRPIITTKLPGCKETVVDFKNGFLIDERSVDALFNAMKEFVDDSSLCKNMGHHSRKIAESKFDVEKVSSEMMNIMDL